LIWPLETIWSNFCELTRGLLTSHPVTPRVVNLTTFGVCWGAVDNNGELLYPVISWKCARTRKQLAWAEQHLDLDDAYLTTGAPPFYFNTAFSLRWMVEHRPDVLDKASAFLLMPQLFVRRLTGENVSERSMATTTMLFDLASGDWSARLFDQIGAPNKFPSPVGSPADVVGAVTREASAASGIPVGVPVCAGGHDTVLAGSGACRDLRHSVLYSTGTWSILVATRDTLGIDLNDRARNMLWQLNAQSDGVIGGFNTQGHMIGGLAFDTVRNAYLPGVSAAAATDRAGNVPVGSGGVYINPTFVAGTGPNPKSPSAVIGWEDGLDGENAVRAVMEGLAYQTRDSLGCLRGEADSILVGGGFAKNRVFGQILADVTGKTVELAGIPEVTTVGTAVLAMVGAEIADSVESAWERIDMPTIPFEPRRQDDYEPLYARHRRLIDALAE
ncbi:MAG: FGGY-family carbohydrate kinase, partial [Candidatus Poribacteria bacterium]|nr:FGGY-family carbohydrate kinase [Candidatus Poribacteria bacterium]